MKTFNLRISTPEGDAFNGDVIKISLRGTEGDLAVMAGHTPFVTSVVKGRCTVWTDEETAMEANCEGGLLTVGKENVTFISGTFKFE